MDRQSSITVVKQTGLSIHQISFKNISNGAESVEQFFTNIRVTYSSKTAPDWVGKIERKHFYLPNFVVTWYTRYAARSARQQKPWLTCRFGRHRYGSQKISERLQTFIAQPYLEDRIYPYHSRWRSLRPVQSRGKDGLPRTIRGPSKCYWR